MSYTKKQRILTISIVSTILSLAVSHGVAQNAKDEKRVAIQSAPTYITVPEGEPLVLWVRSVEDGVAHAVVLVEEGGGLQQLTPCDNISVLCEDSLIPAEGTEAGDTFYLASE